MRTARTIIVGAGFGGLAAALCAARNGDDVLVLERQGETGGKARTLVAAERPIAAGPTVLTMRWVFDRLLAPDGLSLDKLVTVKKADILARHAWPDGERLDLHADIDASAKAIEGFAGLANAEGYRRFCDDIRAMFETLKDTYIDAQRPGPLNLMGRIGLFDIKRQLALKPLSTLWSALATYFPDPRLQQLFGRYATYCGSSPFLSPATLMLVAHVEQAGVWLVDGGMSALAKALARLAQEKGVSFHHNADVTQIVTSGGAVTGVVLSDGTRHGCTNLVFNGDSAALQQLTGKAAGDSPLPLKKRSLSARTWCIEAETSGFPLAHHTVFFSGDYRREFREILAEKRMPADPTIYICAQDRDADGKRTDGRQGKPERMLFIINAAADGDTISPTESETHKCLDITLSRLDQHGLSITGAHAACSPTTPSDFHQLFPATGGALYGRAQHGWRASFLRPGARTPIKGIYLAGGSVHPGPGVPMATLSGILAAQCLAEDQASTRQFHPAATFGGMSTA